MSKRIAVGGFDELGIAIWMYLTEYKCYREIMEGCSAPWWVVMVQALETSMNLGTAS